MGTDENTAKDIVKNGRPTKYYFLILGSLVLTGVPQGAVNFSPVFVFSTPPHRCFVPEFDINNVNLSSTDERNVTISSFIPFLTNSSKVLSSCKRYSAQADRNCSLRDSCMTLADCDHGWKYGGDKYTAVREFNLVCDNEWKVPLFTVAFSVGAFISGISVGTICDKFGRRRTTLGVMTLLLTVIILYSFAPNYEACFASFLGFGFMSSATYSNVFVHMQEMALTRHRDVIGCVMAICMSSGYMLMPLIAYLVDDWRWVVRWPGLLCLPLMSYYCFIPESPLWLRLQGRGKEANLILKRLYSNMPAECDNRDSIKRDSLLLSEADEPCAEETSLKIQQKKRDSFLKSLKMIFTNKILLVRALIICWIWIVSFICYYTFGYNTSNLGGNIYVNSLLSAAVEIPGWIFAVYMLKMYGRRVSVSSTFAISGVASVLCALFMDYYIASIVFGMIGKTFASTVMVMSYLYSAELYPTTLRSTGVGIASTSARLACLTAPYVAYMGKGEGRRYPFYIMGSLAISAAILTLRLPETGGLALPDTTEEALSLKRPKSIWKRKGKDKKSLDGKDSLVAKPISSENDI